MSKPRTGAIFTQDILHDVTRAMEMHKTSKEETEDVFRRKVHALQKFLHHGMSRFSVETLQHVLLSLNENDPYEMDNVVLRISSLKEVRNIVKRAIMKRESGSFRTSDVDSLHYMELFFYCVYCMSEAKRLFGLLYQDLFYSYYNPDHISRQNTRTMSASGNGKRVDGLTNAEHYSQFGISTLDLMTGSTHHKLKQTVQDMKMVLDRWTDLLTENELNPQSFDPESEQDLVRLHGASGIEPVLRLVPDMFAKYYKCLELAKQWWSIAHEIYTGLPFQRRPSIADDSDKNSTGFSSVTLQDLSQEDENESVNLDDVTESDEISNTFELIQTLNSEIEVLERREEKFEVLMETYNKVGADIDNLQAKRNKLLIEQEFIKAKGIPQEIASIEAQLNSNSSSLKLLEFQHALLFEDYVIHLELRPSIIHFLQDAKLQLNDAQNTLIESRRANKNDEQTDQPPVFRLNINNTTHRDSTKTRNYHSEYSLQRIEKGVQEVSDRCIELEQESTIMRARKQSLSKLNKKHSKENNMMKTMEEEGHKNKSSTQLAGKRDINNNRAVNVGLKTIAKVPKNDTTKPEPKGAKRNDIIKTDTSPKVDPTRKENVPKGKPKSVSESQAVKRIDTTKHGDPRTEKVSDKGKPQGGSLKKSEQTVVLKPVQEHKGRTQKSQPNTNPGEQRVDRNHSNDLTTSKNDNNSGPVSRKTSQTSRKLSESKGPQSSPSSTTQNTSTSGKENETKSKARPNPPISTRFDQKRPRAK